MWVYCDVRDLAQGFRLAVEDETLGNETFFITADDALAREPLATLVPRHLPGTRGDGAGADRHLRRPSSRPRRSGCSATSRATPGATISERARGEGRGVVDVEVRRLPAGDDSRTSRGQPGTIGA